MLCHFNVNFVVYHFWLFFYFQELHMILKGISKPISPSSSQLAHPRSVTNSVETLVKVILENFLFPFFKFRFFMQFIRLVISLYFFSHSCIRLYLFDILLVDVLRKMQIFSFSYNFLYLHLFVLWIISFLWFWFITKKSKIFSNSLEIWEFNSEIKS